MLQIWCLTNELSRSPLEGHLTTEKKSWRCWRTAGGRGANRPLGVDEDTIFCWGDDHYGQSTLPEADTNAPFKSVDAGYDHTCGVRFDGTLACWGNNAYEAADPPAGTFDNVSAGDNYTCAVGTDGALAYWGMGGENDGSSDGPGTPPTGSFKSVNAGQSHTCAVRPDDTVACWGCNNRKQSEPPAGTFKSVSAGGHNSCGIRTDDTIQCWGDLARQALR